MSVCVRQDKMHFYNVCMCPAHQGIHTCPEQASLFPSYAFDVMSCLQIEDIAPRRAIATAGPYVRR